MKHPYRRHLVSVGMIAGIVLSPAAQAFAHVSAQGPVFATKSGVITFGVGHGCEGLDTLRLQVAIPESVTSVRAMPSAWGDAALTRDDAEIVTAVTWEKSESRPEDDQYYQFAIRISVPDAPFTRLYLPTTQTCLDADGEEVTVEWAATVEQLESAGDAGAQLEPAPFVWILPARSPGWNRFTVGEDLDDLTLFDDAQIVWAGDAAYSSNPTTKELIASEDGVDELTELEAGTEIWVKY